MTQAGAEGSPIENRLRIRTVQEDNHARAHDRPLKPKITRMVEMGTHGQNVNDFMKEGSFVLF